MPDVTVKSIDDMEAIYGGLSRRARAELGVTAWGMQVFTLPPDWDGYPNHNHGSEAFDPNQEEVYIPLSGAATLVADGRRGRSSGRGIYRYGPDPRAPKGATDPGVYTLLGVEPRTKLPAEEIQLRCALAMVNEAVRCFGDGILRAPRDGDVGAIFGLGFPRFRGGPFRYVDTIGAADVLRRVQSYADRFGDRWRPAPLLVQMAKKGERFFA